MRRSIGQVVSRSVPRAWVSFFLVLCATLLGCSGFVKWRALERTPQHQLSQEVVVYVVVSPRVARVDDGGNVAALVDGLERELVEHGKHVTVVGARLDEPAPVPRVELQFQVADAGNPGMRGAGQTASLLSAPVGVTVFTMAESSEVLVDVYAVPASGRTTFAARIHASDWGSTGFDSVAFAESAGHAIGRELARPNRAPAKTWEAGCCGP